MRIGLDGIGMQSGSAGRGIGRYLRHLSTELAASLGSDLVVYLSDRLPSDKVPAQVSRRTLGRPHASYSHALQHVGYDNPDGVDLLLIGSPFETHALHWLPEQAKCSVPLASIAYDLVPLLFPDQYLAGDPYTPAYKAACVVLKDYRHFLSLSDATSADFVRMFDVDPAGIVNISAAIDPDFFRPGAGPPPHQLTGGRPFVLYMGQSEARKNLDGAVRAFAALPTAARESRTLVVICPMGADRRRKLDGDAARLGISHRLRVHDRVSDADLRSLYCNCDAFLFPSLCEGFGLPLLEAMACGAPVVAGDNSSQPEVAGDAAVLVDASNPGAIAQGLAEVLHDPGKSAMLRLAAIDRASRFSWRRTADLALRAMAGFVGQPAAAEWS